MRVLTIIGVGLIGGSIALAAKRKGAADRVIGVGRTPSILDQAVRQGLIDEHFMEIAPAVVRASTVVVCTPVDRIADHVLEAGRHCPSSCLLTDAGSAKGQLVQEIESKLSLNFVGSHPLAGSEKRGHSQADAKLFENRSVVITPTERTPSQAVSQATDFWQSLGAKVLPMHPAEHDRAMAYTSHLPHLLAATLSELLPSEYQSLTASGFRDTTRIAAGDPALWTAIFNHNRPALLAACDALQSRLQLWQQALEASDSAALASLLSQAKRVRDALGS